VALSIAPFAKALPPPVEQYGANCADTTYASDQLICNDPSLLELDRKMLAALADASAIAISPTSPMIEAQPDWFRRRSMCALQAGHRACLVAAYAERTAVLVALTEAIGSFGRVHKCTGSAIPKTVEIVVKADGAVRIFDNKRLIAVALPVLDSGYWMPFLRITGNGKYRTIQSITGAVAKCRPNSKKEPSSSNQ